MSDPKIEGLAEAHRLLVAYSDALPKRKWWQLGRKQLTQMQVVSEISDRIFEEIQRRMPR